VTRRVHYAVEVFYDCVSAPLCENNAGRDAISDAERDVEMTDRDEDVTCRRCLKALGYAVPVLELQAEELPNGRFQVAA
jgi:hypothetical protein